MRTPPLPDASGLSIQHSWYRTAAAQQVVSTAVAPTTAVASSAAAPATSARRAGHAAEAMTRYTCPNPNCSKHGQSLATRQCSVGFHYARTNWHPQT